MTSNVLIANNCLFIFKSQAWTSPITPSSVQHLAPVIEAVSEASNEAEEALDEEEYNLQQQINQQQLEQFNHQQNGEFHFKILRGFHV